MRATGQTAAAPLLAQVLVRMEGGQASLIFDGAAPHGPRDTTYIAGTLGSLCSDGPDLGQQTVTLTTAAGRARPDLAGTWFNDGFRGAMGALLVAIEDDTEPANGAEENLQSLALAFAAIQSRTALGQRSDWHSHHAGLESTWRAQRHDTRPIVGLENMGRSQLWRITIGAGIAGLVNRSAVDLPEDCGLIRSSAVLKRA